MSARGYRGRALSLLESAGVSVGDDVVVMTSSREIKGVLMPRYQYADDAHIVIKLSNGYNVGISIEKVRQLRVVGKGKEPSFTPPPRPQEASGLPKVLIIGTGGTIASRIDYRTGGVKAVLTSEELYHLVPELSSIADISTQVLFNIYSENMTPHHWSIIARAVEQAIDDGFEGVVIMHGTDTMHFTSAALSFALQGSPIPIVVVGSQRSSDRPSSDSATNLIAAVRFAAYADASGVFVSMHEGPSDDSIAIHSGVRVRKLHTSRRDAFRSVDKVPVARVKEGEIIYLSTLHKRKADRSFKAKPEFSDKVSLLKIYPGFEPLIITSLVQHGIKGIVVEGTGLGHAPSSSFSAIRDAISDGIIVCMTSQCIFGTVRMTVYETGRDLLHIGVIPLGDMLAEVAYAKLSWLLAQNLQGKEMIEKMQKSLVGEIARRRTF